MTKQNRHTMAEKRDMPDRLVPIHGGEITYWVPESELKAVRESELTRRLRQRLSGFLPPGGRGEVMKAPPKHRTADQAANKKLMKDQKTS